MRAVARDLRLPPLSTVEELCDAVSAHLDRPIRIAPRRMRVGEPSGFVERLPAEDVVHVEQETSGLHRAHIVCHELAHLLCGHLSAPAPPGRTPNSSNCPPSTRTWSGWCSAARTTTTPPKRRPRSSAPS
ncbi:hypothetical protein ACFQ2M_23215 [Kitasatospora saccharophila]|uniref:hypothetical protein n=1 Tax=Kitasatospora saccharophila TaxID=407973 RepID=UPI003626667D